MTRSDLTHLMGGLYLQDDSDDSNHGDSNGSFLDEFFAVGKARKWKVGSKAWKKNWEIYTQAENDRLERNPAARLESWQRLCVKLGVEAPPTIKQCRNALSGVYVNIVDVLECWATGARPKKFGNARQLAAYTNREGKFFGRNLAKKSKMLRVLLKTLA